jgi:hypothetical protein
MDGAQDANLHAVNYPKGLEPDHEETLLVDGLNVTIPSVSLSFRRWTGKTLHNTLGGKPVVEYDGKPMFAELAIVSMCISGGWSARWVETYASRGGQPRYLTEWADKPLNQQQVRPVDSSYHQDLQDRMTRTNHDSCSGCWDVLAWKGHHTLFMESKHYRKDRIRKSQVSWLSSGLSVGLMPVNFLIVLWEFVEWTCLRP